MASYIVRSRATWLTSVSNISRKTFMANYIMQDYISYTNKIFKISLFIFS